MNITTSLEWPQATAHCTALHRAVAIVDDDPQISQALGQWVELQGLTALYFSYAECLIEALISGLSPLNVGPANHDARSCTVVAAILDLNLPGMSGLALAHRLRVLDADLPLVIVTALRENERYRYGTLPPGVTCLQKPFDLDALENALFPVRH